MSVSESTIPHVQLQDYQTNLTTFTAASESREAKCNCPAPQDGLIALITGICRCILGWRHFELMMGIIITLNAFNIGWTIDRELRNQSVAVQDFMESCFLVIFVVEIGMRIIVKGWICLKVPANLFDFVLVAITSLTTVMAPVVEASSGGDDNFLQQVMILRMMRLLRLARAVRLVATFRPLWKLAKGLTDCCTTMFSALLLMMICIYIFACFGAEFISKVHMQSPDPEVRYQIEMHFSSLPKILLTLMRFTTMDSAHSFYAPLVYICPGLAIYFLLLLVIVAIALMNLITALLVEDAINSAKMDQEMRIVYCREKIKTLKPALKELFNTLDKSGDGVVEVEEVVKSIREGIAIPVELQEIVNPARMLDLFEALDVDHSGDLSENEFVEGLCCVAISDMPRETMQVLQLLRQLRHEIRKSLRRTERASSILMRDPSRQSSLLSMRFPERRTSSHLSLRPSTSWRVNTDVERQMPDGQSCRFLNSKEEREEKEVKEDEETVEAARIVLPAKKMTMEEKDSLSKEILSHEGPGHPPPPPGFEI